MTRQSVIQCSLLVAALVVVALGSTVTSVHRIIVARREIARIGESHSRAHRNIEPALYVLWLDSLCEAIEQHDPSYTPDLEALWRRKMQAAIDQIVALF